MKHEQKNNCPYQLLPFDNASLTRRGFVVNLSKAALLSSCIPFCCQLYGCLKQNQSGKRSLVGILESDSVWFNNKLINDEIKKMLNQGIQLLTGHSDEYKAWNSIFSKNDRVAIKVNTIGRSIGSTKPEMTLAVCHCLHNYVHIPLENIIIFDRFEEELLDAGYQINLTNKGIKVIATHSQSFSTKMKSGEIDTTLTSIITKQCTAIINLALLKTHPAAGISLLLKNHYGSIPKEIVQDGNLGYHSNNFKNLVYLNALPSLKDKTRLYIIDSLIGQYNGGPNGDPRYQWKNNVILMGIDPIALDTIGLKIINEKRMENNLSTLKVKYLKWAEEEGLGTHNLDHIQIIYKKI